MSASSAPEARARNGETVHGIVCAIARHDPGRPVVLSDDGPLSYGALWAMVERLRGRLRAMGVEKSDRVALLAPPSIDFLVAYLAITSLGAIYLGLNPKYTLPELSHLVGDADPVALLGRDCVRGRNHKSDYAKLVREHPALKGVVVYDDIAALLGASDCDRHDANTVSYDDPCALIYTSGTTGRPKGALIPHGGLVECCRAQAAAVGLDRPVVLNNLPINHIGCVGDITAFALVAGGAIVFQEAFDPAGVLDAIERHRVTWWGQIPTMFQLALDVQDKSPRDLSSVRRIFTSGAPAPIGLISRLRQVTPHIQNGYGMTETVGSVTWVTDGDDETLSSTIGAPIAPYRVRLADERGVEARVGEAGEVQVCGAMHMLGYWRNPEATAAAYTPDGWMRTGDLASVRPDGAFQLVGRLKEAFKSGGYNVYPLEIEQALESMDEIAMAAVVPIPDPVFHEVGVAYVVANNGSSIDTAVILGRLRDLLANYKLPKRLEQIEVLPLLANGKLDRRILAARARLGADGG